MRWVLIGVLAWCCASGCGTPLFQARLSRPVIAEGPALLVKVEEVHPSADVRVSTFSEDSRVVVVLDLYAHRAATFVPDAARLRMQHIDGRAQVKAPLASGIGAPPSTLRDGEHCDRLRLEAGEQQRVWLAFGEYEAPEAREIPLTWMLELPSRDGSPLTLALSNPGNPPVWRAEPITYSQAAAGFWVQATPDAGSLGFFNWDNHAVVGPLVLGWALGFGMLDMRDPVEGDGSTIGPCCSYAAQVRLGLPVLRNQELVLTPYFGGEGNVHIGKVDVETPLWLGPTLGVELSAGRLLPEHGPFPIDYPLSVLGAMSLRLGLVQWFGPGLGWPTFGASAAFSFAFGY